MSRYIKDFVKKKLYPHIIYRIRSEYIYLTFDDGPDPKVTPDLLKMLDDYKIKATFFLEGTKMEKWPQIVKMIIDRNHSIGSHSYKHESIKQYSWRDLENNFLKTQKIFNKFKIGEIKIFRPPYGEISFLSFMFLLKNKLKILNWSVDSYDSFNRSNVEIISRLNLYDINSGDILLFHDDSDRILSILPTVIENLLGKGFQFDKIRAELF